MSDLWSSPCNKHPLLEAGRWTYFAHCWYGAGPSVLQRQKETRESRDLRGAGAPLLWAKPCLARATHTCYSIQRREGKKHKQKNYSWCQENKAQRSTIGEQKEKAQHSLLYLMLSLSPSNTDITQTIHQYPVRCPEAHQELLMWGQGYSTRSDQYAKLQHLHQNQHLWHWI